MNVKLEHHLSKYFQHTSFRTGQKEIIQDIMKNHDVFGVLPTGSGKSLCYQLPAQLLPGTTIVVSPLISLMIDQVRQLKANQFKSVVALNSFMTWQERKDVYRNLKSYKLIYVSPELLQNEQLVTELQNIHVNLFVIDEAHCISQWGHEFRPDYLRLINVIELLNNPPILALTATATHEVQQDILTSLNRPNMIKHVYPIDRPNIALSIDRVSNSDNKLTRLISILSKYRVPTIIYFSSRRMTENVSQYISNKLSNLRVSHYHGGMESIDRITIQQQFMNDQLDVICCTSAFGMGINKQNIRLVIHYHFPAELESYIQEVGRAGRDGLSSVGIVLFSNEDISLHKSIIQNEFLEQQKLKTVFNALSDMNNQNIHDIEQKILGIVDDNEVHWRFLQYQLEKHDIIKKDQLINNNKQLQTALHSITSHVQNRYEIKLHKLTTMLNWLNDQQCLRHHLYSHFRSSYEKSNHCCNNCGFTISSWQPSETTTLRNENASWKEKLNQLFLIGAYDETR